VTRSSRIDNGGCDKGEHYGVVTHVLFIFHGRYYVRLSSRDS